MKNKFYIFFSWQSDVKGNVCFIHRKINNAVKEIAALPEMNGCTVEYDHSTQNRSGSPEIVSTIHEKINKCDVFIGDVTPIANIKGKEAGSEKLIPNPNVMAEAGFALRAIGEYRIILLMRSDMGKADGLPFDIRHRRINCFSLEDKPKLNLTDFILEAIRYSRKHQDNIYEQNTITHDSEVYKALQKLIMDEKTFMETNEYIVNNQQISCWELKYFDCIEEFLKQQENVFLLSELQEKAIQLKKAIHNLTSFTGTQFSPMKSRWVLDPDLTAEQLIEAERNSYYSWIDRAAGEILPEEEYDKLSDEIIKGLLFHTNNIVKAYSEFRSSIRVNLFL